MNALAYEAKLCGEPSCASKGSACVRDVGHESSGTAPGHVMRKQLCQAMTLRSRRHPIGDLPCNFPAKWRVGTRYLCGTHAAHARRARAAQARATCECCGGGLPQGQHRGVCSTCSASGCAPLPSGNGNWFRGADCPLLVRNVIARADDIAKTDCDTRAMNAATTETHARADVLAQPEEATRAAEQALTTFTKAELAAINMALSELLAGAGPQGVEDENETQAIMDAAHSAQSKIQTAVRSRKA